MLSLPLPQAAFSSRHIGLDNADIDKMLDTVNVSSLTELLDTVIPKNIRRQSKMTLQPALSEHEILAELKELASKNQIKTSLIGMGYYNCHTPPVIQRNILENPAWYTAYTPYQPEISQGRLEAILNFQTM
ncbi:MAG: glycine dehydrogenase (aminomethyl-transferring), partial [Proteobacteria bacterium]|nr:glycine dehydrogenase (aminomethyl-transferring) [Pseudomonadota bacterium]